MRHVKRGSFMREEMPRPLRHFAPDEALHSLSEVDLDELKAEGKKLILLDVDNTLLPWRSHDIPPETITWISRAKSMDFSLCVLSNTRKPERLTKLCQQMGLEFIRDKFKPSTRMFLLALQKHQLQPDQAVMIGDQLMTDVLGANRAGIDAIWVRPMAKREFVGTTVVSRNLERVVGLFLYRYFQPHDNVAKESGLFRSQTVWQFAKFVGVGVVATVVDWGLTYALMNRFQTVVGTWALSQFGHDVVGASEKTIADAALPFLKVGPVMAAILTSYLLNRAARTFAHQEEKASFAEGLKFFTVAGTAALFNVTFTAITHVALKGSANTTLLLAQLAGMAAGFLINFVGQRVYTFRKREPQLP